MKKIVAVLFLFCLCTPVFSEQFPLVEEIIKAEGQFVFTDGSSYYRLDKDGTFESGPLSLSGRTISGKWHTNPGSSSFEINGKWGFMNGLSLKDDERKMVMIINAPQSISSEKAEPWAASFKQPTKIYQTYFIIQQLIYITGYERK